MAEKQIPAAPRPDNSSAANSFHDRWYQWIAENRLQDCSPESMLATMVANGMDPAESRDAIAEMDTDPVFLAARRHQQLLLKLESVVGNLQKLWQSASKYPAIEKRTGVSRDEFLDRYVRGCRPLVLRGVADDWPAMQRWSPAYLKSRFGHLQVEIQDGRDADPHYERNKLDHRRNVLLADFVDKVVSRGPTNDYYLTANNEVLRTSHFAPLLDDIGSLPDFCDRSRLPQAASFWFGPAGTVTPLHHDTLMLFHTQIVGRKRWRLISPLETPNLYNHEGVFSTIDLDRPDLGRFPKFAGVKVLEAIVEPGETMFLPLAWWHQVTSLDLSLSLSFSNLAAPNHFDYFSPDLANW